MKKKSSLSVKKSAKTSASTTDKKAVRPIARVGVQSKAVTSSVDSKGLVKSGNTKTVSKAASSTLQKVGLQKDNMTTTQPKIDKYQIGLSTSQLQALEDRLMELKSEIKDSLEGKSDIFNNQATNESLIKGDDAEVAEKQRQSNAALQEMDMLKNRLLLVDRALKKIEHGVYGMCEETEEPIGFERLIAIPWARYGVKVQELRERRLRDFRVNRLRAEV